ncbi:PH domain-containing protein [Bowmanella denitrificans]|uniref:PH domain-containing protein n=1 Tax=Bowmanella denitrificans TaxID=366582 RepID=UPI001FE572CE|nr:PH domain-containing protein [Bowmanella denitrificans]
MSARMDNSATATLKLAAEPGQWQRLSPVAIMYFAVAFIRALVGNFVYLLPALLLSYNKIKQNPQLWLPALGALLLLCATVGWLKFHYYRYRLYQGNLQIKSGVLQKKHLDLPFERIQNIRLEQPLFYRPTDHVCMLLDTAGSAKQEAKIYALPKAFAEQLKSRILNNRAGAEHQQPQTDAVEQQEQLLNARSTKDLIIHGITSNRIWLFLGGLAPFYDNMFDSAAIWLERLGVDLQAMFDPATQAWWQYGIYLVSLVLLLMLGLTLLSIGGSLLTFHGFRLTRIDDRYIRRSGLLTRHEVSMKLSRLQMIVAKQDWLDRVLGRINLKFEQLNASFEHAGAVAVTGKLMVPSVKADECEFLMADALPGNQLADITFTPISRRHILRTMLLPTLVYLPLACIMAYKQLWPELMIASLALFTSAALLTLRWWRWGYASDAEFMYIRKGLLGIDRYCLPIHKIQQTRFSQSLLMKRSGLCSIKLVLACGAQTIPYIPSHIGHALINTALHKVEREKRPWM